MATLQMKIDRVHAEFLAGNAVSSTVTTHSVVSRDGSGNVHANKFKSANMELTHNAAERSNDTVFYSSDDDVIRKNTAAGMRGSLGLNNVNNTGATVAATADKIVLRDSEGDIFAAGVSIDGNSDTLFSYSDGTRSVYGGCDSNDPWFGTSSNHDLRLVTYGGERMRIDNTGNVGIGVTSPGYKLHVNGSIYGSGVTTPYLTGHGYIAERSYTFNPTSNTTKYFLGWTDQDSMQISIRDSGWGHGGTLYATVYFQWGNTPSIVIHKQSGDYTFYYTYKNDRMYLWFNNSGNSNNNNIIHSIRMRTTVGAISTTEPGSTETYASTTIGSSAATEFTTIRLCSTKDGNVGIGTTSPSYTLDVGGDINLSGDFYQGGSPFVSSLWTENAGKLYYNGGNVGIGESSPSSKLHIDPGTNDKESPGTTGVYVYNSGTGDSTCTLRVKNSSAGDPYVSFDVASEAGWALGMDNSDANKFKLSTSWSSLSSATKLTVDSSGNVGIGTTSPSEKLHVSGDILATSNVTAQSYLISNNWISQVVSTSYGNGWTGLYFTMDNQAWTDIIPFNQGGSTRLGTSIGYYGRGYFDAIYRNSESTLSDDRVKYDEILIDNATSIINKLKPQTYTKRQFIYHAISDDEYSNIQENNTVFCSKTRTYVDRDIIKPNTLNTDEPWFARTLSTESNIESGLIAQDIWYNCPELRYIVNISDDASPAEEKPIPETDDIQQDPDYDAAGWGTTAASVNYTNLIPYLIKSNQELHERIKVLENLTN